jgi:multiple sugar transport system permease protein
MFMCSLKTRSQIFSIPPVWIFVPTFDNFKEIFFNSPFPRYALNSVIVSTLATLLALFLGLPAAYGLARLQGSEKILLGALIVRMLPPVALCVPLFLIFSRLKLVDTYAALPLLYLTFTLPFVIWLMKAFIEEIPTEIEESALIDGCSRLQVLLKIIIPLSIPGLIVSSIFCFIWAWNDFILALIFTRTHTKTAIVDLSSYVTDQAIWWGLLSAAAVSVMIPPIVITLVFRRYMVKGLTFGAVK